VKVLFKLSGVAAVLAAVVVGVFGVAGSSAASTKASSFTLGIVADTGGLNDHGFNHLAYEGQLEAQKKLGVKIQTLQATSSADYVPYLTKEAEDGDNLVVAVGFDFIDALGSVAKEFPKTKFAIIDTPADAIKGKPKNVEGLTFDSQQSGYLAGYLSGLVSKAKGYTTISSVGGQDIPSVTAYIAGYQQGGKAGGPEPEVPERLLG
jgi:basic membrane protein A